MIGALGADYDKHGEDTMSALKAIVVAALAIAFSVGGAAAQSEKWKKIRIGTEGEYPPFNFIDSNKQIQGFDIDIAKALCEKLKAECTFVAQDWDGIIPALVAGKYDAIVASMSITEERKKRIDFTDKYYHTPAVFVAPTKAGLKDVSPAALKGKTLGAQSSTIHSGYLEDNYKGSTLKFYKSQDEANADLAAGRLDAVLADKVALNDWLKKPDAKCCAIAGPDLTYGGGVGIGLRKEDQDLKSQFNKAIKEILADGTYKKINDKYFTFSIYGP